MNCKIIYMLNLINKSLLMYQMLKFVEECSNNKVAQNIHTWNSDYAFLKIH